MTGLAATTSSTEIWLSAEAKTVVADGITSTLSTGAACLKVMTAWPATRGSHMRTVPSYEPDTSMFAVEPGTKAPLRT